MDSHDWKAVSLHYIRDTIDRAIESQNIATGYNPTLLVAASEDALAIARILRDELKSKLQKALPVLTCKLEVRACTRREAITPAPCLPRCLPAATELCQCSSRPQQTAIRQQHPPVLCVGARSSLSCAVDLPCVQLYDDSNPYRGEVTSPWKDSFSGQRGACQARLSLAQCTAARSRISPPAGSRTGHDLALLPYPCPCSAPRRQGGQHTS